MSQIYVFDAYGTLFDVHSAAAQYADALGPNWQQMSDIWRTKQLEYTWIHAMTGQNEKFYKLTEEALDFAIASTGEVDNEIRKKLLEAYQTLKPYSEVKSVLSALKERGARLAILSNGDERMLDDAVSSAGLNGVFDAVLSVEPIKVFKPDFKVYEVATDTFSCQPGEISFQSSNRWDIAGAHVFGFKTVWINRLDKPNEYPTMPADRIVSDLHSLLD